MARKPITDMSAWPSLSLEGNLLPRRAWVVGKGWQPHRTASCKQLGQLIKSRRFLGPELLASIAHEARHPAAVTLRCQPSVDGRRAGHLGFHA